jgi:hypothetical protein
MVHDEEVDAQVDVSDFDSDDSVDVCLFDLNSVAETRHVSLLSRDAAFPNRVLAPASLVPQSGAMMKRVAYSSFIEKRLDPPVTVVCCWTAKVSACGRTA